MPKRSMPLMAAAIVLVGLAVWIGVTNASGDTSANHVAGHATGRYAVIVVVDGARADEFKLATMPNLAKLAARGAEYTQASVGQLPSITETSHATVGTGVYPKRHHVLGDSWRLPGTEKMSPDLLNTALDRTGYVGRLIRQAHVPSLAGIIHHTYPGSTVVALSGHKVYAADAMGAGHANFVAFGVRDSRGHFVPSVMPGETPARSILSSPKLDLPSYPRKPGLEDDWATILARKFLFQYRPRVLMINLPEPDVTGHLVGTDPSVMGPLMTDVDRDIGWLVAAYRHAGLLSRTDFLITSDHGMVPRKHVVSTTSIFRAIHQAGGAPLYVGHGDDSTIWLKNASAIVPVGRALAAAKFPHVDAVYIKSRSGKYQLVSSPDTLAGANVNRAYQDLLGTFDNASSPDIVLLYDKNTITMDSFFWKSGRRGDHEGATWGSQHIGMFLAGPGIKSGYRSSYPARLVDVAPTIESLLGATPSRQDGVPLADAMTSPPRRSADAESHLRSRRLIDVNALERQEAFGHSHTRH
ncbi:MAG: alkaline phosphatase family protein [Chloroflexota bacterium]